MKERLVSMTPAQVVADCLKRHGVEYLFGQSNPSNITLACMDAGIRQIAYRQENSGTYMAQAYGMATRKVPVVTAQNGPAATLLVPGLAECLKASFPVVAIVQQISLHDYEKNAFQDLDHNRLFDGCAKWVGTVLTADRIEDYIDMAFTQAASGRPGPAVLLFPINIFNEMSPSEQRLYRTENLGHCPLDRPAADPLRVREAAALLASAKRPVVYAGGGVISSRAQAELRALQENHSLPVATTMMGKGSVDESHPLSIGVGGYITGKRGMAKFLRPMLEEADVVFLVGNRTNQNGTDSWTILPKNARYIHLDVDPVEIGRNYEALRLAGDAKTTLAALNDALAREDGTVRRATRDGVEAAIRDGREKHRAEIADVLSDSGDGPVRPELLLHRADALLGDDAIFVADASFSSIWVANYVRAVGKREFYLPRGLAGLGWGMPMAMGVRLARAGRKIFCVAGDGGFAHVWSELETCKREGIDVVTVVLNNACLGYQHYAELAKFNKRSTNACTLYPVDYAGVAKACGLTGLRLEHARDIDAVLGEAFAAKGAAVVDMITDVGSVPPVGLLQKAVENG